MSSLTLGSLFDGSGGFPLGGIISGIEPVWASEIEPFPIRVTTKRMPFMKHYGDVAKISGSDIEPVDIITFGSPCQDMSMAGKRSGLDGDRSCLFYEAVRIIKEMRSKTNGRYPRYAVWENVPGAFSSNKGEDFRAVLETLCSVSLENVSVPRPQKWSGAGEIMGDGFSIAWRTLDAQYWGVPQRRKRIYLVADFAGGSAGEVLFESEGMSGYSEKSFGTRQSSAGSAEDCSGETGRNVLTLFENHSQDTRYTGPLDTAPTVMSTYGTGGNNQPFVVGDTPKTLKIRCGCEGGGKGALIQENKSSTLSCNNDQTLFVPRAYGIGRDAFNQGRNAKYAPVIDEELQPTMVSRGPGAVGNAYTVRKLTPTECARLQGFPDWWCSDLETEKPTDEELYFWYKVFEEYRKITNPSSKPKSSKQILKWLKHPYSDSAEYKMWGNGVALPCVVFVLSGIVYNTQKST